MDLSHSGVPWASFMVRCRFWLGCWPIIPSNGLFLHQWAATLEACTLRIKRAKTPVILIVLSLSYQRTIATSELPKRPSSASCAHSASDQNYLQAGNGQAARRSAWVSGSGCRFSFNVHLLENQSSDQSTYQHSVTPGNGGSTSHRQRAPL